MTITQAVAETGKSERTIRRWIASHRLPSQRKAGRLLVNLADIGPDIEADSPGAPDVSGPLADCQARVRQLEADVIRLTEVLAEVRSERDYLRQLAALRESKLIEAESGRTRRGWRWPWSKSED